MQLDTVIKSAFFGACTFCLAMLFLTAGDIPRYTSDMGVTGMSEYLALRRQARTSAEIEWIDAMRARGALCLDAACPRFVQF